MRFRNWFESEEESGGPWAHEHPWLKRLGNVDYNKSQVNVFVEAMADKDKNAAALYQILVNRSSYSNERYNKPIADNLLIHSDQRLKNAIGTVQFPQRGVSPFAFIALGDEAGTIKISPPPVIYDEVDKHLLASVVIHELTHADHWSKDRRFKPAKIRDEYGFNYVKYARHWTEARAYSQQLIFLLRTIPNRQTIVDAFSRPPGIDFYSHDGKELVYNNPAIFSWSPLLLDYAKEFLAHYQGRNEGILSNIAAPLITAASMLNPTMPPQTQPQPVMQQQVVSQSHEAASLIKQIVQKMLFRNFLIQA